jgi:hypothetical protein
MRPGIARAQSLALESRVFARDRVMTRAESRAQITLADQSVMSIGERTDVEIQEFRFDTGSRVRNLLVRIAQGIMRMTASSAAASGPVSLSANLASVTLSGAEAVVEVTATRTAVASRGRAWRAPSPARLASRFSGEGTDVAAAPRPPAAVEWRGSSASSRPLASPERVPPPRRSRA